MYLTNKLDKNFHLMTPRNMKPKILKGRGFIYKNHLKQVTQIMKIIKD